MIIGNHTIFDFNKESNLENWAVVDDVVMGGKSDGKIYINDEGHAVFEGLVSLKNKGGFSSIRYSFGQMDVADYSKVLILLKGDGKRYQLRVKTNGSEKHAYATYIHTSGLWQWVEVELSEMTPTWNGTKLNLPGYPGKQMTEFGFLIGNKKAERFRLEIDIIKLR